MLTSHTFATLLIEWPSYVLVMYSFIFEWFRCRSQHVILQYQELKSREITLQTQETNPVLLLKSLC